MADNPEIRDLFNQDVILALGARLSAVEADFDEASFIDAATTGFGALGFKERMAHIATAVADHLPADFSAAARIVQKAAVPESDDTGAESLEIAFWPLCHYVQVYGLGHFEEAMATLYVLTKRVSAQWAVRPFLEQDPEAALVWLERWVSDPVPSVRGVVSEGTRPRLPWAPRLRVFQSDPARLFSLLDALRDDPHEAIRRSVANHPGEHRAELWVNGESVVTVSFELVEPSKASGPEVLRSWGPAVGLTVCGPAISELCSVEFAVFSKTSSPGAEGAGQDLKTWVGGW
jgi:3-methyladenine DNA glycosylase AlkC